MMNSVVFGTKDAYDDFGLILKSKVIGLPEPKTEKVDVPYMDGLLDLTEALSSKIRYKNRNLELTFSTIKRNSFYVDLSEIAKYLHGKKMRVILSDDPNYYFFGRCTINVFKTDKAIGELVINVDADPYKMETDPTSAGQDWLWDPFSFVDGIIRSNRFDVDGTGTFTVINRTMNVSPTFVVSGSALAVTFNNKTYDLPVGTTTVTDIILEEGENTLTFTGTGTVVVKYQGGIL